MSDTNTKKLTVEDPVDAETLARIRELHDAEMSLGKRLLDMEMEKISIMVSTKTIQHENQRIFERILFERGLPADLPVEISAESGKIIPLQALPSDPVPEKAQEEDTNDYSNLMNAD